MALAHYRESHPLAFVVTHYINLVAMILLICSGFIIHYPFAPFVNMGVCRGVHVFCGFVLIINVIVRVILAFVIDAAPTNGTRQMQKEFKTWLPQKDNKHQAAAWIKFYLFVKKDEPLAGKFNPMQKIAYLLIPILILLMGYTGLALWSPTAQLPFFAAGVAAVGGAMSMRIIHYFGMFVFIIFMIIHIYMAVAEGGLPLVKLMFTRKEHGGITYDINTHALAGEDHTIKD